MMWRNWNKADKTLLAAGVLFLFSLCLHIQYPKSLFADGILFCAEAALVGGIADWFAVTALFRKPLGFPYHTAILPRRRKEFTEATGRMLQNEFFSKKNLLRKAKSIDYGEKVGRWLADEVNFQLAVQWLNGLFVKNIDVVKKNASDYLIKWIDSDDFTNKIIDGMKNATENGQLGEKIVAGFIEWGNEYVSKEEFRTKLLEYLEDYKAQKLNNPMAMMMAGFAEATDLVNLSQAADLVQAQCQKLLIQLGDPESGERQAVLSAVNNLVKMSLNNEDFKQDFFHNWSNCRKRDFCLEEAFSNIDATADNKVTALICWFSKLIVENFREIITSHEDMRRLFNETIYQITGRGALQAQEMLGDITREVMDSLTDEQMNHLIYDKAEPDLLWIRMNGSIVGAAVGLVIFTISVLF